RLLSLPLITRMASVPLFGSTPPPYYVSFFFYSSRHHRDLHSFPTRRSSDLFATALAPSPPCPPSSRPVPTGARASGPVGPRWLRDRKSTRLNSSHVAISYAVFCLKKKKKKTIKIVRVYIQLLTTLITSLLHT